MIDAIKRDRPGDGDARHDFTYCVVKPKDAGDKRSAHRRRTRLRSGKLLDPRNALLIDCQVYDRSEKGARIRLIGVKSLHVRVLAYEVAIIPISADSSAHCGGVCLDKACGRSLFGG